MSYYYNTSKQYSSQEDDNFGDSQDSYLDNDMNQSGSKSSGSMDKESQEYKKRRQKNNEGKILEHKTCLFYLILNLILNFN